ncbi:MAG: ATP synthase F1 subunit epsilon [Thermoguttaceae bacterium]
MNCTVVTPDKTILDTEAAFVALPLFDGEYGVMPGHSPMVGRLGVGELRIKTPLGETCSYFLENGFVEVLGDSVNLLTSRAIPTANIDVAHVQKVMEETIAKSAPTEAAVQLKERTLTACRAQLRLAGKQ